MPSGSACHARGEESSEKDPAAAEAALIGCLICDDVGPATYQLLATLRTDRGAHDRARETLQAGVRRFPQSVLLWRALGRLELSMSRQREGLSAIAAAHRLDPDDEGLEAEYRDVLARYGNEEDRLEAIVHPLLLEAVGRFEIDDAAGAIQVLETALKRAERSRRLRALVLHRLAIVQLSLRDYTKGRALIERALKDVPRSTPLEADLLVTYSEILLYQGDAADAVRAARDASRIEPKNPLARANLGLALSISGDLAGAMSALFSAIDCGLGRRLTKEQFLGIGAAVERLKALPEFPRLLERAWPSRSSAP